MARWQRWINALVLKTSEPFGSVGSNPTLVVKRKGVDIDLRKTLRTYWMSDENWYTIKNDKFVLTPLAPPKAIQSFKQWNKPQKLTLRKLFRIIKAKLF